MPKRHVPDDIYAGDTVMYRGHQRFVLNVGPRTITFLKIHGSWTDPNPKTVYLFADIIANIVLVKHGSWKDVERAKQLNSWKKTP